MFDYNNIQNNSFEDFHIRWEIDEVVDIKNVHATHKVYDCHYGYNKYGNRKLGFWGNQFYLITQQKKWGLSQWFRFQLLLCGLHSDCIVVCILLLFMMYDYRLRS